MDQPELEQLLSSIQLPHIFWKCGERLSLYLKGRLTQTTKAFGDWKAHCRARKKIVFREYASKVPNPVTAVERHTIGSSHKRGDLWRKVYLQMDGLTTQSHTPWRIGWQELRSQEWGRSVTEGMGTTGLKKEASLSVFWCWAWLGKFSNGEGISSSCITRSRMLLFLAAARNLWPASLSLVMWDVKFAMLFCFAGAAAWRVLAAFFSCISLGSLNPKKVWNGCNLMQFSDAMFLKARYFNDSVFKILGIINSLAHILPDTEMTVYRLE